MISEAVCTDPPDIPGCDSNDQVINSSAGWWMGSETSYGSIQSFQCNSPWKVPTGLPTNIRCATNVEQTQAEWHIDGTSDLITDTNVKCECKHCLMAFNMF